MASVSGVTASMTAQHFDRFLDEGLHEHTWHVTAFYPAEPFRDGRLLKRGLEEILAHIPIAGILPDEIWSSESIASFILRIIPGDCIGVRVVRAEGFETWMWL